MIVFNKNIINNNIKKIDNLVLSAIPPKFKNFKFVFSVKSKV